MMTPQAWLTLALVVVGAVQAIGIWTRVVEARRTRILERERFEYKKKMDARLLCKKRNNNENSKRRASKQSIFGQLLQSTRHTGREAILGYTAIRR